MNDNPNIRQKSLDNLIKQEHREAVDNWVNRIRWQLTFGDKVKEFRKLIAEVKGGRETVSLVRDVIKKGDLLMVLSEAQWDLTHKRNPRRRNPVKIKDREETLMESAARKFAEEASKPLRKPTEEQLRRWARMDAELFGNISDKDREKAWKRGYLI